LVKIKVVGFEPRQRAFELHLCSRFVALVGLAGQEILAAVNSLEADAHLNLGIAIARNWARQSK